jgi:hypothetical protein
MTSLHHSPASLDEATGTSKGVRWRRRLLAFSFPLAWVLGTLGYLHYSHGPELLPVFERSHSAYVADRHQQAAAQPGGMENAKISPELLDWDALGEDFRESNRQQAAHLHFKLRAFGYEAVPKNDPRPAIAGFSPEQVERLAIMEHDRWVAERRVAGWVYGESSDKPRRINANLVPWEQLTESTKGYDREAVRLIPALLDSVGQKICRKVPA